MELNHSLYYTVLNCVDRLDHTKEEQPLQSESTHRIRLYHWCWAEYQNKIRGTKYTPYTIETGIQEIQRFFSNIAKEKLETLMETWRRLDRVSFRHADFTDNEVIVFDPSNNAMSVLSNLNVYISFNIGGRYCPHRLLLPKYQQQFEQVEMENKELYPLMNLVQVYIQQRNVLQPKIFEHSDLNLVDLVYYAHRTFATVYIDNLNIAVRPERPKSPEDIDIQDFPLSGSVDERAKFVCDTLAMVLNGIQPIYK